MELMSKLKKTTKLDILCNKFPCVIIPLEWHILGPAQSQEATQLVFGSPVHVQNFLSSASFPLVVLKVEHIPILDDVSV